MSLQDEAARAFTQFPDNQMKGNINKCHLLMNKDKSSEIHLGESIMKVSDYGKPLVTKIA